jgi:hypothetical protein
MNSLLRMTSLAALTLAVTAAGAFAQGGPGGPGGGGGFDPAMMRRFQQWREKHKFAFQVSGMVNAVARLANEQNAKLTQAQAKKIYAVLGPWTGKPAMNEDEAKNVLKSIKATLNVNQLNAVARIQAEQRNRMGRGGRGGGGGRGPGGGGPGGGGGGFGAARPGGGPGGGGRGPGGGGRGPGGGFQLPDKMNPLNTSNPRGGRMVKYSIDVIRAVSLGQKPPARPQFGRPGGPGAAPGRATVRRS